MENKIKKDLLDILKSIGCGIILAFVLMKFVLMGVTVDGSSMYPTLHDNDYGYSFIITKTLGVKRFDIVVLASEKFNDDDKYLVKRLIGLPGETIEFKDNNLYINGEYTEQPFLKDSYTNDFSVTLADDEYYCMGDNREVSKDSRYYGPFTLENIKSTHVFVFYPFNNFGMKK